jgi:hypothetical protein
MIGQWYLGWCCNITYCNHLVRPFVHTILLSHFPLLLLVQLIGYLVCDFDISCTFSPAFRSVEYLLPVWRNGDLVKIFTSGGILSVTSHAFFFGIVLHHHQYILISCRLHIDRKNNIKKELYQWDLVSSKLSAYVWRNVMQTILIWYHIQFVVLRYKFDMVMMVTSHLVYSHLVYSHFVYCWKFNNSHFVYLMKFYEIEVYNIF